MKLHVFARNCKFWPKTVDFCKTAHFGVTLHSFVHLFFSLLGTGCAVLSVSNCSPGVSISVGVAIYYLVFSPSSHASSELRVRGGRAEGKRKSVTSCFCVEGQKKRESNKQKIEKCSIFTDQRKES